MPPAPADEPTGHALVPHGRLRPTGDGGAGDGGDHRLGPLQANDTVPRHDPEVPAARPGITDLGLAEPARSTIVGYRGSRPRRSGTVCPVPARGGTMGRRWAVAVLAVLTLATASACTSGGLPGLPGIPGFPGAAPKDPRSVLTSSAESLQQAGSATIAGSSTAFSAGGAPITYDGTLSWSDGTTGEIHTHGGGPTGAPTTALITKDAIYGQTPQELGSLSAVVPGLAGKKWIKQSLDDLTSQFGPIGALFRASLDQANPVRSSALLLQAGDLREVGPETRNAVSTTHYSGTVRFDTLVTDLKLGLSDKDIADLRDEAKAQGTTAEQLDLWLDERGYPVHAEARTQDPKLGPLVTMTDYSDYGGPKPVVAPPADQVLDAGELRGRFGIGPN